MRQKARGVYGMRAVLSPAGRMAGEPASVSRIEGLALRDLLQRKGSKRGPAKGEAAKPNNRSSRVPVRAYAPRALAVLFCAAVVVQCAGGGSSPADRLLAEWARAGIVPITGANSDGSQSLAVLAQGGYFAVNAKAKAGVPSVLRIYTHETYDCSRAFQVPELKVRRVLPASGVVEIPVPARPAGSTLFGTCSMGMYTFRITFE